ncbi:SUMF1/EgtB/PvdO family nonheme iron enzyme, partial [Opitutales bacterium]|nr:SUMF1/EgtB/PvdO family nonheme iron enzyme [Opitutales bacterium]
GEFITHTDSNYTVPEEKVLVIISGKEISLGWGGEVFRQLISGYSIIPSNTLITSQDGWTGLLLDPVDGVSPVLIGDSVYQVPTGKKLVITSTAYTILASGEEVFWNNSKFGVIESGQTLNIQSGFHQAAFSGYLIDENRSLGGGFIYSADQTSLSSNIESGSITRDKLSEEILAELSASVSEEELNSTISEKLGSIPPTNGQLLSVPSGTEPPLGYTKISDSRIEWKMESRNGRDGQLISTGDTLYSLLSNSLAYYDKNDSVWRRINAYPSSDHTDGAAIFFDGKIYAIGGTDTHSCSIYDIGTGNWSVGPDIPSSLPGYFIPSTHLTVAEDQLYAIFVEPNRSSSTFKNGSTAFAYKLNQSNSWIKLEIEDFAFISGGVAAHENKIFFFGGTPWTGSNSTPVASTNIFKCYDITTEEITSLSPLPQGVVDPSFFIFNDHLYVLVGPSRQFFKYSFLDDEWNFAKDLPFNNNTASDLVHSATLFKEKVWLTFEGTFSGTLVPAVYSYSGGSDQGTNLSANTSVTPSMLSDSILKYLRPEIVEEPSFTGTIRNGTRVELNPGVEGKYVTYQWYKDGEPIDGVTSKLFTIDNFDVGYHDGNYTVVASNDFGDIESAVIELAGKNNDFRGVDISSMNFEGQDLSDALFDSSTIFSNGSIGANFSGTGVKLDNLFGDIDLRGVNLHGADLRGSNLSGAQFNEQTFITAANLSGTGAVFPAGNFDLTGANVAGVDLAQSYELIISSDTVLTESDGSNGLVSGANLHAGSGGSMIVWNGVPNNFRGVNITGINFEGQDLSDALFDSSTIFSNGSIGANFSGTGVKLDNLFGDIDLRGVNLHGADLRGSNLSGAQFNEQTFITAANLSGTGAVFPDGTFDLNGSTVAGVDFSESNNLIISYDTILTEYDEELGRYVGANIAFSTVNWGGVPDDLRGVNIAGVELTGQDLSNVQFDSSTILSSDVLGFSAGASLSAENSSKGANLNLHGNVDLRGVNLYHANLTGSDLREANLNGTILHANNLTRVNLCGVDLASAQFGDYASSHTYDHTYYNSATIFPEGFNPNDYPGLVLVEDTFTVEGGQGSAPFFLISNDQGTVDFTTYQLRRGSTYAFRSWEISQEHSFMIGESYGDMESSMVFRGPLTRENEGSLMFLTIPEGFDGSLFYFCPDHSSMVQEFTLSLDNHFADLNSTVSLEMIWVEPGTFTMGSPTSEAGRSTNETQHEVTLTQGFYLGKYEVTQAQYEAVMTGNTDSLSATPSQWPNNPNRPVEKVSWEDVQVFITRLNAQQSANIPAGWAYVLPTESQWEYASRAGTTAAYSWGATIASSNANYNWDGAVDTGSDFKQTRVVGQYAANPWGFFDMHGNVWEWTADWYGEYSSGAQTDPGGPATGSGRVFRGGSWGDTGAELRSAYRVPHYPSGRSDGVGFRVGFQQQ